MLQCGIFLFTAQFPGMSQSDVLGSVLEYTVAAERCGYDDAGAPNTTSRHGHDPTKIDHAWAVVGYVADSRQEAQRLLRTTLPPWLTASLQSYVFLRPGDRHREDVQTFLRLILRTQGLPAGYVRAWTGEMDALLQQGQPFTLVFLDTREEESHEDRELRTSGSRRTRRHLRRFAADLSPSSRTRRNGWRSAHRAPFSGRRLGFASSLAQRFPLVLAPSVLKYTRAGT